MGRLFDAVTALLGIFVRENTYEGQAAMMLEAAAACGTECESLPLDFVGSDPLIIDWKEAILELLRRRNNGVSIEDLARSFHITLADIVVEVAMRYGISTVVLSGGCFQNSTLLELCAKRLTDCGFTARWPQRVPLNDGGLALGQVQAAMRSMRRKE
jgi:hydrogenase maturation protein HypF